MTNTLFSQNKYNIPIRQMQYTGTRNKKNPVGTNKIYIQDEYNIQLRQIQHP